MPEPPAKSRVSVIDEAVRNAVASPESRSRIFDELVEANLSRRFLGVVLERERRHALARPLSGVFRAHVRNTVRDWKASADASFRRRGLMLELHVVADTPDAWALAARRFLEDHFDVLNAVALEVILKDDRFPEQTEEFARRLITESTRRLNRETILNARNGECVIMVWISANFLGLHDLADEFRGEIWKRFGLSLDLNTQMNRLRRKALDPSFGPRSRRR